MNICWISWMTWMIFRLFCDIIFIVNYPISWFLLNTPLEMPDCSENFENEIRNGKNIRSVSCKYCSSIVLTPGSASFATFEFQLPLITQSKTNDNHPETEDVSLFWEVKDIYTFHNIGFSKTIGNNKFLTCADCEIGPIGYHDIPSKISYVALSRVSHC